MRRRIYTDTSVIGGCLDEEFRSASTELLESFMAGTDVIVLSDITLVELQQAPTAVRDVLSRIPDSNREQLAITAEALSLATLYVSQGVVGRASMVDARHIAIATIARVDVLVSWNFKHVVNLDRIRGYNSVNLRQGYPLLEIRTPAEVMSRGKD